MRKARNVSAVRSKRGVQGGSGRGAKPRGASRIDQAADLSAGERMGSDTVRESVDDRQLAQSNQAHAGYSGQANAGYSGLRLKAEAALEKLITAPGVPANVRASAVRTALELVGAIGARSKDQRDQEDADGSLDPESLSVADIDREIGKLGRV